MYVRCPTHSFFNLDLTKTRLSWAFFVSDWPKLYRSDFSKTTDPHDLLHSINDVHFVFVVLCKYFPFNLGPVNNMVAIGNSFLRKYKLT